MVDLVVPDPGLYVMVVTYHNPTTRSQELDVDLMSLTGQEKAKLLLNSCKYRHVFYRSLLAVVLYRIISL